MSAPLPQRTLNDDALGKIAWDTYSKHVGGKAYNGDPLPTWEAMKKDEKKQHLVAAWVATAKAVAERVIKSIPAVAKQVVDEAKKAGHVMTKRTGGSLPPQTRKLDKRTACCGAASLTLKTGRYECPCGGTTVPVGA